MRGRLHITLLVATTLLAAAALSACGGGGGGGGTTPSSLPTSVAAPNPQASLVAHGSPPPLASARTAVATASVTLKLPQGLLANNASTTTASAAQRSPKYVNPVNGNYIDIYVDGTLLTNLDGSGACDSLSVASANASGTLNASLPLYYAGGTTNTVVAIEYENQASYCNDHYRTLLAVGEINPSAVSPGSSNPLTLTMQMNAAYVGIVDLPNLTNPELTYNFERIAYSGAYPGGSFYCGGKPNPNDGFALYPADNEGYFVPIAGYGGTSTPQVSSFSSDNGGTSTIAQSTLGEWYAVLDQGNGTTCDGVSINVNASNPAYAIYYDLLNQWPYFSFGYNGDYAYYYGYYDGYVNGPNQGLFNLWWGYGWFNPFVLGNSSVSGYADIQGFYPFTFTPTSVQLLGIGQQATVTISNQDDTYTVSSSNASVATANVIGSYICVTAAGSGNANIYVTNSEGQTTSFAVQVTVTNVNVQGKARQ